MIPLLVAGWFMFRGAHRAILHPNGNREYGLFGLFLSRAAATGERGRQKSTQRDQFDACLNRMAAKNVSKTRNCCCSLLRDFREA